MAPDAWPRGSRPDTSGPALRVADVVLDVHQHVVRWLAVAQPVRQHEAAETSFAPRRAQDVQPDRAGRSQPIPQIFIFPEYS